MTPRAKAAGAAIGVVFGVILSWCWMSDPDVVRQALLFERGYMFFFFMTATGTAWVGLFLVKRYQRRALLADSDIGWEREKPQRRHIVGALIFGTGWGITGACPGPIATQIGQGIPWAIFTLIGSVVGVWLFLRRGERELEPTSDKAPAAPAAVPTPA